MSRFRIAWLLLVFVCLASTLLAQKGSELKKNGERYFANRRWQDAFTQLNQYNQQEKPGDPGVLTKLGICCYRLHQADKARQYLEYVMTQYPKNADPELFYYLACTLHGQQEYEKAIEAYKQFLRIAPENHLLRANARDNIRRCVSGMNTPNNDAVALVENLGDRVNTAGDEFAPLPSYNHTDRLYFSAAREGCIGGMRNDAGFEDNNTGHWCSDMFYTRLTNSGWDYAGSLGSLLNTSRFEVALDFGNNGRVLRFFRGFTLYGGEVFADTAGTKDEYSTNPPAFVSPMKSEDGDGAPCFFNDTTMLFASRRDSGLGGLDLYLTVFANGAWSPPDNLGPAVNSAYDETTPFLARDGRTLYFSSNRTEGIGGLDVYKIVFDDVSQKWSAAFNMGTPVNSPGDDAFFRLAADGRTAFLASDRLDNYGERDLYTVYFKEDQAEQSRTSSPPLFSDVAAIAKPVEETVENKTLGLAPLFYDNDRNVLRAENLIILEEAAAAMRNAPGATLVVTVHTDETGPAKFDLYYGIKRAEMVGKALLERGVPATQILLRSAGSLFPIARNVMGAEPNPQGQQFNRRIELSFASVAGDLPVKLQVLRPDVPPEMAAGGSARLDEMSNGLAYKVEMSTTRQVLNNDALNFFNDLMIESQPGSGLYRYTAGFFKRFDAAAKLRPDVLAQGFTDASVVAYINGIRISKAEAVGLLKKYPDLATYVKN